MAVTINNFVGKYRVAKDPDSKLMLQDYIDLYGPQYLTRLLGCDLYTAYLASPDDVRFLAISEPFCIDVASVINLDCEQKRRQYVSRGFDEMITGFTYFHFVPDSAHKQTTSGSVVNLNENSKQSDLLEVATTDRFNLAVESYQSIQFKIKESAATYPEYNGLSLRYLFYGGAF